MFRGKDGGSLQQIFRDNLQEFYEGLVLLNDTEPFIIPDDSYTTISEATESARDSQPAELEPRHTLYLFEFFKIHKIGGINSPYIRMKWPWIHIPQASLNIVDNKGLKFIFLNDTRAWEEHILQFHERNLVGRGLKFSDAPEEEQDFLRDAVEYRCQQPVANTQKTPLPPLEDLMEGANNLLSSSLMCNKEPRKELDNILKSAECHKEGFS